MTKRVNIDELVAIDIHTHAEVSTRMLPDEAEKEVHWKPAPLLVKLVAEGRSLAQWERERAGRA